MKSGFRYWCFICASLLATQVFAADMSGWSDKTVCRLVKAGGGQEHIDEATKRGIVCEQSSNSSTKAKKTAPQDSPLDKITISKNMVLIKNIAVFNQERKAIKTALANRSNFSWKGASECFRDAMMDWEASMKVEVAESAGNGNFTGGQYDAYHKPISICLLTMAEQLSRIQKTPDYLQDMMLKWASDEVFKFPSKNVSASEYQLRMYAIPSYLGTFGGYYAIHYQEFDYTDEERKIVENYFSKQLIKVDMRNAAPRDLKPCDYYSTSRLAKGLSSGQMSHDTCGSPMLKATTGAVALGLRLGNQDLFNAGIKNLKLLLKVFDDEGIFVPYASGRGATALGYSSEIPLHLGAWTELLDIAGYDFLEHVTPNGMSVKELLDAHIKVLNDPDMLLKYTAKNPAYGGKGGPTVAGFNKLSLIEKWNWSNTGIKQVVRQSARYVERFRPDLQEFRDQSYVQFDQHGNVIKSIDDHILFDPYMLYEANTKEKNDITITTSISLSSQREHTKEGLASWLKSIKWEGSLEDALSLDGSLGDDALADGVYNMHYMTISNHTGKLGSRSYDKLTVLDGGIIFEALPRRIEPVQSQRETMKFETNNGLIIATGNLQYELADPIAEVIFRGVIGNNFLIGTTVGGRDIVMLHLKKR
jgi:hypothetical protein